MATLVRFSPFRTLKHEVAFVVAGLLLDNYADFDIARDWKLGTLKVDGQRSGTEKSFRN